MVTIFVVVGKYVMTPVHREGCREGQVDAVMRFARKWRLSAKKCKKKQQCVGLSVCHESKV